jgi:hypothetical protein
MAVSGLVGVGIGQNDERAEQRSAEPGRQDDGMLARPTSTRSTPAA